MILVGFRPHPPSKGGITMVKINKKVVVPCPVEDVPVGEVFMFDGRLCMRISINSAHYTLNLENGKVLTGIPMGQKVQRVNVEINVTS
jgi:hypothetical protein